MPKASTFRTTSWRPQNPRINLQRPRRSSIGRMWIFLSTRFCIFFTDLLSNYHLQQPLCCNTERERWTAQQHAGQQIHSKDRVCGGSRSSQVHCRRSLGYSALQPTRACGGTFLLSSSSSPLFLHRPFVNHLSAGVAREVAREGTGCLLRVQTSQQRGHSQHSVHNTSIHNQRGVHRLHWHNLSTKTGATRRIQTHSYMYI